MRIAPRSPLGFPAATHRIQFTPQYTFAHAADLIPYLHSLGVTECCASPVLTAHAGSPLPMADRRHDTALRLPSGWERLRFRDLFTGLAQEPVPSDAGGALPLAHLFRHQPVAPLEAFV
jgi:hypothetical protein